MLLQQFLQKYLSQLPLVHLAVIEILHSVFVLQPVIMCDPGEKSFGKILRQSVELSIPYKPSVLISVQRRSTRHISNLLASCTASLKSTCALRLLLNIDTTSFPDFIFIAFAAQI
eukprot:TRINITY_DN1473_c0_g1_i3.p1 TRINITY_DN1473_c0_g1~~TRINITY_DN1473_c0_g1_i3.p1  ORF type:complete len:115 (-),score=6.65 TRINITY_DN1473_c0_g1_i3:62-406(-)